MKTKAKEIVTLSVILLVVLIASNTQKANTPINNIEGQWDISQQVAANGYEQYLIEEHDFDYSDEDVYAVALNIKSTTASAEDAVRETAKYVARNVRYSGSISISYCYDEKASDVLESGIGDCVSMSRLATALLRAQGIPARTMGGCLSMTKRCTPIFAAVPYLEAQVTPFTGDYKKRGFLHEYVEVWTQNGWKILEATSGQLFPFECNTYLDFGYDSNQYNRCVIQDNSFWQECINY